MKNFIRSFRKKYQPSPNPEVLLTALDFKGAGRRNECFLNAFVAVNRFDEVEKYVLGYVYFKSDVEPSPQEHAWVKVGDRYHDPTIQPESQSRRFRYSPVFELSNEEVKQIIYSQHTQEEQELIKKGEFPFEPPTIGEVVEHNKALQRTSR